MRKRITNRVGVWALIIALCAVPASQAQAFEFSDITDPVANFFEPVTSYDYSNAVNTFEVGFDAAIVRPLAVTTLIVGAIFLGPAVLLTVGDGKESRDEAIELYLTIPYEDAFERELGDF